MTDLWGSAEARRKRVVVEIDSTAAARQGVSLGDVASTLEIFLGRLPANDFQRPGRIRRVHVPDNQASRVKDLRQLMVRNGKGEMVPLGTMVSLGVVKAAAVVYRLDDWPAEKMTATPAPGVSLDVARKVCDKAAELVRKELRLPSAYRLTWLRQNGR